MTTLEVLPVDGLPEVGAGDAVGALIAAHTAIAAGDIVVVAQKIVSKAEGRVVRLADVEPSQRARELAARVGKDPALVELILSESASVIRAEPGVLIVETTSGWICANAGIDASNVPGEDSVALLPADPDASARRVRDEILDACGAAPGVIVADSFGRPWRIGQSDVAIGCAGVVALDDWRGRLDRERHTLGATLIATADELAAAAELVCGKDSGIPAALVRGLARLVTTDDGPGAARLQRPAGDDLFR